MAAQQTAEALGLFADVTPELRDCDYGEWTGRSLDEVQATNPEGLGRWLSDPTSAPHGGEALAVLIDRVSAWLEALKGSGQVVAVTHASVIKATVLSVLHAPASAVWRIGVAPLSMTRLSWRDGFWTLKAIEP